MRTIVGNYPLPEQTASLPTEMGKITTEKVQNTGKEKRELPLEEGSHFRLLLHSDGENMIGIIFTGDPGNEFFPGAGGRTYPETNYLIHATIGFPYPAGVELNFMIHGWTFDYCGTMECCIVKLSRNS